MDPPIGNHIPSRTDRPPGNETGERARYGPWFIMLHPYSTISMVDSGSLQVSDSHPCSGAAAAHTHKFRTHRVQRAPTPRNSNIAATVAAPCATNVFISIHRDACKSGLGNPSQANVKAL
mmetsp:Transcript_620/g.1495  ORF Transcript_620/g.1495 Transcript_620/m.1495 type:complete len:120 (+) Transcript_620:1694-2053(+)